MSAAHLQLELQRLLSRSGESSYQFAQAYKNKGEKYKVRRVVLQAACA